MTRRLKLILATFTALLLLTLLVGVKTHAPFIAAIDTAVIHTVVQHNAFLNPLVIVVTNLGNPPVVLALTLIIAVYFLTRGRYRIVTFIAVNMIGVNLANFLIKQAVQRPRPFIQNTAIKPLVTAGGYSFPSGHSAGAMLLFGTLFILAGLFITKTWSRRLSRFVCLAFVLAIGLSRIYVQVHFPTDVLAGYACGFTGLMLSWGLMADWLQADHPQSK